ncbi:MAG: hypothetical protein R6V21_13065 [Pelovirga sp.]
MNRTGRDQAKPQLAALLLHQNRFIAILETLPGAAVVAIDSPGVNSMQFPYPVPDLSPGFKLADGKSV